MALDPFRSSTLTIEQIRLLWILTMTPPYGGGANAPLLMGAIFVMIRVVFLRVEHQVLLLRHILIGYGTNKSSVLDMDPATSTSPLHGRPSSLPGALPHLMDALYAELDSVTLLLETQARGSLSARDLDDITHLIKVSAAFRERLRRPSGQAGPGQWELTPIPSSTLRSSPREPIHTPTSSTYPHGTPCYPRDRHSPLHARVRPHHFPEDMTVSPPTPVSFVPDPRGARHGSNHPTFLNIVFRFLNIVFRRLIALAGPTKGRKLTQSYHYHEPSGGHSHP